MSKKYVIGIDFGSLSGRTVLYDPANGTVLASRVSEYAHAVMSDTLPDGKKLPPLFALQYPGDYLDVLRDTIPAVLADAGADARDVAAIGWDFTACTMLPIDENAKPLCDAPEFSSEPHAYVKMWKHHAAQPYADRLNALAKERNEEWLAQYGGKISSEWMIPKMMETLAEAPEVFRRADAFVEAADWLTRLLTGSRIRSKSLAGFKANYANGGYPSKEFLSALDPALANLTETKLSGEIRHIWEIAGKLNAVGAKLTGLCEGTAVSAPIVDAHAPLPVIGAAEKNSLLLVVGTSVCHILTVAEKRNIPGSNGYVWESTVPGCCTYDATQSCGDQFEWFIQNGVPASYTAEAEARGIRIHQLLREKAGAQKPGEHGLLALDWLNGNRCILSDGKLTGMILGLTLNTKPEDIYRALIEATAFGTKIIYETYLNSGVTVDRVIASGGIAEKDPMLMQIYADVLGCRITVPSVKYSGALGSAVYASLAAGMFPSLADAVAVLPKPEVTVYEPIPEHTKIYEKIFREYRTLHDYFGRGENDVMKRLLDLKTE